MREPHKPTFIRRLWRTFLRLLSLGAAISGIFIVAAGLDLRIRLNGQFQTNLNALAVTIGELSKTVSALQEDTAEFNTYLDTLRQQLKQTVQAVEVMDKETQNLLSVIGTTTPKVLGDASIALIESSKMIKETSNQIGHVPKDPFASQRSSMYKVSGTLLGTANTIQPVADQIGDSSRNVASAADSGMESITVALAATDKNLETLQTGSLKHLPDTMEALSGQLQVHLQLIESSRDVVLRVTTPVIALGIGILLIGLRGFLWVPEA